MYLLYQYNFGNKKRKYNWKKQSWRIFTFKTIVFQHAKGNKQLRHTHKHIQNKGIVFNAQILPGAAIHMLLMQNRFP